MQAQQLNKDIFETIYYNALKASSELAAREGPYETYSGCPVSKVYSFQTVLLCQFDENLGFFYGFIIIILAICWMFVMIFLVPTSLPSLVSALCTSNCSDYQYNGFHFQWQGAFK